MIHSQSHIALLRRYFPCIMADGTVGIYSPPSGKNTSVVWECFGHPISLENNIRKKDKTRVICKICKTVLKHSGNTTNMKTHLSRHHPTHSTPTPTTKRNEVTSPSQNLIKTESQPKTTVESNRKKPSQQTLVDCMKKQEKYPINIPELRAKTVFISTFVLIFIDTYYFRCS